MPPAAVVSDEEPTLTTTRAAPATHLVHADALVLLSDIDAVYDGDPRVGPAARIDTVSDPGDLAAVRQP